MLKLAPSIVAAIVAFGPVQATRAQDDDEADRDNTRRCVALRRLKKTRVVDDLHVLFFMRGSDIYVNRLSSACNGLRREGRFSYRNFAGQLCEGDHIRVLRSDTWDLGGGIACRLGTFRQVEEEEADSLMKDPAPVPVSRPLPMPTPDPVGGDETGDDEE